MLNPVRTVLFVIRPCMKQFKIRSCMLQSVKVQVRCTSALTVRTPASPGFVEWSMPSDAWVDTTELSGEKKKEQSPDTVMEEPTEPAPGTVIAQVEQQDAEEEPSEPKEETRRVVLVTMEPEESTEVIVKPPEQEPERSTEVTEKPSETVKEKGLETEKRESGDPKDLPEPEIPEKPFVETEKAQEATSEQEVTFRMKAWSNWLHRQDQKDEEKRIRNRARQRALRQQRRSDREAGLQQAVRKGPSLRRSWTVTVDDPLPKGSVQKVLKHHTKAPRRERIVKLRLIEREVQASRISAKGEFMIQNRHRAWIAPKARPQAKSSATSSRSQVRKEFVEIPSFMSHQKGVTMVSLTGSEASDVGNLEEIHGALPESTPTPTKGPKSASSGLTGHERITSESIVRIHADAQGGVSTRRQDIKPGTAYYMKRKPEEPGNVKYTSQVRAIWRPSSNAAVSIEAASTSGSEAGHQVLTLTEEILRLHETTRRTPRPAPSLLPMKAKAKPVGPQPPPGPPPGWTDPVVDRPEETASPAVAKPKEPASPVSVDQEKMLEVIAQTGVPEPKTPPIPGPKTPPTPTTRPKAKSRPLTEEQKAVADEVLAQKARDLLKAADLKRDTGTLEEEKPPTASGRRQESTEVLGTSDRRGAREAFSIRASIRATGRSDRMGEGTQSPSERRGRTPEGKGAVSVREDGTSLGAWKGGSASPAGRVRERKTRSSAMEGRRGRSREFEKGETNFSRATRSATESGRSGSDTSAKGNVGTDGDDGRESRYAARSASSAIVRGRDCVPQATAGASVQVFGQEGRREVGRDVRSVQVPPKRGVEPPIRARAHFSNPAFDAVRKKEVICTVESEPEFEFEYPIELRGNRLAKHILQSHTPYDPSCAVCLMSKGLKRAPKRTDQVTNEIQMDIANLCTHPKSPNMYRYVVMWNRTHGMIATAAIYVDQASTIRVLTAAINHCSSTGAMVLSDEGRDLTALISELIRLKVVSRHETSRPGRHATGAERAVRTLKTQLGCIRTVLYQHGLMLGSESLRYAAANACHVHNAFQLQANSSLTPYQRMRISVTSSGEAPNTNRVMPFGCLVFARPTDGYLEKVREANARHFVPGIYLTPKLSSLGHFVAFEGSQDETVVVPVRDLKIASPIRFVAGLGMLCEIPNSKSGVKPDRIERLPNDLSKPQKLVDLPIHEGEPPWYWSEVNKTSRCPACSNGSETGHSVKCRNRYKKYLEEEYKRIVPIEDESSVPVVPEGLEEGLDTEGKPESQQESGERVPESESEREKRKRKSIDDEWDRFHREHEEKETGERFPEFDDVPFHAPKGQEADTEPTPMQEDPTNPYEIGKNPEPIEDDRMSEGYEPTEVPEGYRAPESPGESPMDIDLFQKIPRRGKNRNHDHWEVDLDKLVLRRVHHRSRKCVFAASSLPLPMPEDQLVGIQRTYYVDAVDERPVDEIPRDQFKVHVSEFGTQTAPLRRHWKGFTELPIKQLYMYDHQGNAIASLSDLGKELWEKVKDPLSRCSDDEVERFLSSVQEGVLEYSRKVPKETEESKFDAKADSCKVWFGGRWIVLRKPSRATSDIGEGPLDVDATFEGMHTEVIALEKHRTGQVVNKNEAQEYCQMHGIRIISTRWVVVNKHDAIKGDIVRSRLVVRDFATGPSAAELGVSSPTASSEALKVVLSYLAQESSFRKKSKKGGVGKTAWVLDVSTAFLHVPVIHPAVVSLPTGMEDEDGEPLFVILEKAMNGLRSAGMSWYRHLADLLDQEGLTACVTEKTIFAGRYRKGVAETEEENHLIVLMYVDDLLVVGDDRNIQKLVDELSKKLRLKVTGKLEEDRIRFLGKVIEKEEDGTIALYMEKEYYEGMMNLYPGGKESQATPNLFQLYDRDREEDRKPLSPEAAATFRTALGKLGWVAQSRPDLCWLCSMLARGQSQPLAVHETAMRASIRYIRSVADRKLKFRSYEYSGPPRITTYVDASWAAEKSTNRKSTSGAAIFVSDCCVKAFSRLQQSVACSSAEAELYALFEGAKETIGIQHAVAHVYGCQAEELPIPGLLTDSMAARNVTEMSGLLRRLRHIDIRICFLQDAVYKGVISISFVRGTENCADLMTKALSRAVTLQHMETIGVVRAFLISFEVPYDWIGRWLWVMDKVTCTEILIVEFCTSPESEMKEVGSSTEGVEVLTVTEADDGTRSDTIESIREQMISHRKRGKLVVLWSSIPCTGGCPFQYICIKKFGQDYMGHLRELYQIQKKLWKGFLRMSEVADFVAIEWPKRCAYWGWNQTKDFLRKRKTFSTFVDACSVKLNQKGQLVRKTWRIETDSTRLLESLKVCVCDGRHDHLPSKEVNWKETQHYPRRFCELILEGFKAELES